LERKSERGEKKVDQIKVSVHYFKASVLNFDRRTVNIQKNLESRISKILKGIVHTYPVSG